MWSWRHVARRARARYLRRVAYPSWGAGHDGWCARSRHRPPKVAHGRHRINRVTRRTLVIGPAGKKPHVLTEHDRAMRRFDVAARISLLAAGLAAQGAMWAAAPSRAYLVG